jgi:glucose 1-dehydrogenase
MELQGVVALVTGGAHRIGKAIVMELAEAGCDLALHYNSSATAAEETAEAARAMGRRVEVVGANLGDPGAADAVVRGASALGPVQVLINSAAMFPKDTIEDVTPEGWDRTLAVNLAAPVFLTQAFAAALPEGHEGAVINVTDWRTQRPYEDHFSYTVAKGAVDTFTAAAAHSLAPRIRVNAVALGAMLPPPGEDSAYLKALAQQIPLQRVGGTEPVAKAVRFLLESDFVTGEIIRLDGGAHLV